MQKLTPLLQLTFSDKDPIHTEKLQKHVWNVLAEPNGQSFVLGVANGDDLGRPRLGRPHPKHFPCRRRPVRAGKQSVRF